MNALRFKTARIRREWDAGPLDSRLVVILLAIVGYCLIRGWPAPCLTEIFRTAAEQKGIYGAGARRSPHEFWRALDLRTWRWGDARARELEAWVNSRFSYGGRFRVCKYHDVGRGRHFHVQVPPTGEIPLALR